ncbi:MAG: hypothetical protein HZA46_09780 [Planctomycetales bacterium]|nr:hypothetical protein [Planctomycetales bacterium]
MLKPYRRRVDHGTRPTGLCAPVLAVAVVFIGSAGALTAGPSDRRPQAALSVRSQPESEILVKQALAECEQLVSLLEPIMASDAALDQVTPLTQAQKASLRLRRIADRLAERKEPAGVDFQRRLQVFAGQITTRVKAVRQLPKIGPIIEKQNEKLEDLARKHTKLLKPLSDLYREAKFDQCESQLLPLIDELEAMSLWCSDEVVSRRLKPFTDSRSLLNSKMLRLRQERDAADVQEAARPEEPPLAEAITELRSAVESIRKSGTGEFGGKSVTGPELLSLWHTRWEDLTIKTMRCRAWQRSGKTGGASVDGEYLDLSNSLPELFSVMIEAEAARVSTDNARPLYEQYVTALTPLVASSGIPQLESAATTGLQAFLDKSLPLATTVTTYRAATTDLLGWRLRIAAAQARHREAAFPPLQTELTKAFKQDGSLDGVIRPGQTTMSLTVTAEKLLWVSREQLIDRHVALLDAWSRPDQPNRVDGLCRASCFGVATLTKLPAAWTTAVKSLRSDLLADDGAIPLTLDASLALFTAEHGMFQRVGGKISGLEFDSLLPLCTRLEPSDVAFIRRGSLSAAEFTEPGKQVILRATIEPMWLYHQFIFTTAGAPSNDP